jgi:hypothetical protein
MGFVNDTISQLFASLRPRLGEGALRPVEELLTNVDTRQSHPLTATVRVFTLEAHLLRNRSKWTRAGVCP